MLQRSSKIDSSLSVTCAAIGFVSFLLISGPVMPEWSPLPWQGYCLRSLFFSSTRSIAHLYGDTGRHAWSSTELTVLKRSYLIHSEQFYAFYLARFHILICFACPFSNLSPCIHCLSWTDYVWLVTPCPYATWSTSLFCHGCPFQNEPLFWHLFTSLFSYLPSFPVTTCSLIQVFLHFSLESFH